MADSVEGHVTSKKAKKELPYEIVENILSRLPVKPLLRFKCASKSWLYLISDPYFVQLHLDRSIQNTSLALVRAQGRLSLFDCKEYDRCVIFEYPSEYGLQEYSFRIRQVSCNGLLCMELRFKERQTLYLWNPSIKKLKKICNPILKDDPRYYAGLGLGYNPNSKDYEIVRVVHFKDHLRHAGVEIYSLRKNEWTRIQNIPYSITFLWGGEFYNGAIHWIGVRWVPRPSHSFLRADVILSFHLATSEFREIQLPEYDHIHLDFMGVTTLYGRLCLYCHYEIKGHYTTEVWVMREYGVGDSWIKLYTGEETKFPLAITKEGEIALLVMMDLYTTRMCLYDPINKSSRDVDITSRDLTFSSVTTFVESLIPL